uniref:UPF0743 protein C215.06c n=1 Tax=Lygus hesperus TaxID=30085 RepID=A0A0A9ZJK9_LYGHE
MVSFTCGNCQDVVKKPKVLAHAAFCHCNHFTCVDCMSIFTQSSVKDHTSCITETEKYQGKWKQRQQVGNKNSKTSITDGVIKENANSVGTDKRNSSKSQRQLRLSFNDLDSEDDDSSDD